MDRPVSSATPHDELVATFGALADAVVDQWRMDTVRHELAWLHHVRATRLRLHGARVGMTSPQDLCCRLVLVEKGELQVQQWFGSSSMRRGDLMLLTDLQVNDLASRGAVELRVVVLPVWWCLHELSGAMGVIADACIPADFIGAGALAALVRDMSAAPAGSVGLAAGRMLAALLKEALAEHGRTDRSADTAAAFAETRMRDLYAFICLNHHREGLGPRDAAAAMRCSLRTVHKTCADRGTSFNALLTETRLSAAAYQLALGQARISEVAYGCGFASQSHFCRVFKLRFGMPPRRYRRGDAPPEAPGPRSAARYRFAL